MVKRLAIVVIVALGVGACDKCGEQVKFVSPSVPKACGANADQSG